MDWRVAWTAFATLVLAEMGDKTQLAVLTLTASSRQPWAVFLGAVGALAVVTALGVFIGHGAARWLPEALLHRLAAVAFVAIGVAMWLKP